MMENVDSKKATMEILKEAESQLGSSYDPEKRGKLDRICELDDNVASMLLREKNGKTATVDVNLVKKELIFKIVSQDIVLKKRSQESFFELSRLVGQVRFSKERDDRFCTEFVVKGLWLNGAADE